MDRSGPPVQLMRMPRAPSMDVSSRSGLAPAFCAASSARCSPLPVPAPMSAMPMPDMIVRTSAKSRLMSPGTRMRSEMPWTAWSNTVSATLKASSSGVPRSTTARSRSLGMVMSVSTTPRSSASPASACCARRRPSNEKGLVTTATVRMPSSFATAATTGAEPVPVPPPRPAVTKTMSAPWRICLICSRSSWAALRPTSGSEPAPSPFVSRAPSWIFVRAGEARSACTSVLAMMNSSPVKRAAIIRFTALEPPPPRPITLILAPSRSSSSSNIGRRPFPCSIRGLLHLGWAPGLSPAHPRRTFTLAGSFRWRQSPPPPSCLQEERGEPGAEAIGQRPIAGIQQPSARLPARSVQRKPHRRRIDGAVHHIGEPPHARRQPPAHRQVEHLLRQLGDAVHDRGAAGHHHACGGDVLQPRPRQVARHEREDLLHPGLDDLGEDLARQLARVLGAPPGHVDGLVLPDQRRERAAVALLQLLGVPGRRAQPPRDVVGDVVAAQRQDPRVPDGAVPEKRHVGGAAAQVDQKDPHPLLLGRDDGLRGSQRLEEGGPHRDPPPVPAA